MTEVHWRIIANLGFKFRSHFTAHCGRRAAGGRRVACGRIISRHASCVIHYKDMKGNAKCKNWGGFGMLGVIQGHWQYNHSIERIFDFNIKNMLLSCTVFELERVVCRKSPLTYGPPAFCVPVSGDPVRVSWRPLTTETSSPRTIVWRCLRGPRFSCFDTVAGVTDTHRHATTAYTELAQCRAVKTTRKLESTDCTVCFSSPNF